MNLRTAEFFKCLFKIVELLLKLESTNHWIVSILFHFQRPYLQGIFSKFLYVEVLCLNINKTKSTFISSITNPKLCLKESVSFDIDDKDFKFTAMEAIVEL